MTGRAASGKNKTESNKSASLLSGLEEQTPVESNFEGVILPGGYKNLNLTSAKNAKNDEFYTQWADIEREMNAYLEFDPNVFRGKVILLPCDDPEWSNFAKYFALHFADFGLGKLISTSFAADSKPSNLTYQPTLFEAQDPKYDVNKTRAKGKKFVLERKDINRDGVVNIEDLQWEYLEGDGDFQSDEVTALRNEADFVVTNPPFSLARKFVGWLTEGNVKFSIVGNNFATTYKEVFPLIQRNQMWKGATANSSDMVFGVPKGTPVKSSDKLKAQQLGYPATDEHDFTRLGNSCWFTNIDHGRRHEPLQLMTMAENLRYSRHKEIKALGYRKYDNFDAIEVPFVDAIPSDYDGMMGVPVTFLDKYNPDQFEILFNADDMDQTKAFGVKPLGEKRVADYYAAGGTGGNSKGHRKLFLYSPRPWVPFKRIVIRKRGA
jgi:hypothetical protein